MPARRSVLPLMGVGTLFVLWIGFQLPFTYDFIDEQLHVTEYMAAVRSGPGLSAVELIDHIMRACDVFAAGAPQHDDMTLVVVRVE